MAVQMGLCGQNIHFSPIQVVLNEERDVIFEAHIDKVVNSRNFQIVRIGIMGMIEGVIEG